MESHELRHSAPASLPAARPHRLHCRVFPTFVGGSFASAVLLLAGMASAPALPADTGPDERLLAGDIVAHESAGDTAGASAHMEVLVHAPPQAVWEVILSCKLAFAYVDGLQDCEVLEDTGPRALVRQVVDQGWLSPTYAYVFESLRQPYRRIDVHLVEGDLRALDALWIFEETAGGTRVDYELRIQPALPAPRFLVRRNLRRGVPDMLACIRGLADGSGSPARQREDLARCPGALPPVPAPQ
jgi:ribosome-associated toxin RatA of RatAB toxin-antitoxin module